MIASAGKSLEEKPRDIEAGSGQATTAENTTPVASPSSNVGFLGMFNMFTCCVAPRKHHVYHASEHDGKRIGTGARSRERRTHHRYKHLGHHHLHSEGIPHPVIASPIPSSSASSASTFKTSPALENWMGKFADWRLFDIPIIPGTHHSGVNNPRKKTSQPVWGWAKTQDLGIEEQLHIGVRFFDLRIRVIIKTGEVLISHGLTSDTSLHEALEVIAGFVESHPEEGVLLYIRADKWHGIDRESSELLSNVILNSPIKMLSLGDRSLSDIRMRDLAGKALVIAPEQTLGDSIPSIQPGCLQYCDIWQENSIEEAKAKIEAYMNKQPDGELDFFGGVALDGTFPIRQQSQTSRELNAWFVERLTQDSEWKDRVEMHPFGIVLIDFAEFDLLNFLIRINNKLHTNPRRSS